MKTSLVIYCITGGLPIKTYSSFNYQVNKGESRVGVEIKKDNVYKTSKRLYFETHEKKGNATEWVESGVLRDDNTVFYFIGDFERAWLFSKRQILKLLDMKIEGKLNVTTKDENGNETSKGVAIPIEYFEKHPSIPIKVFDFIDQNINHIPCIE